ncbi:MAG: permease [Clostridia bacterium]|nr:permease [Clostridia bacterium]MDH7572466.1 permease [Clostridia bacterium]
MAIVLEMLRSGVAELGEYLSAHVLGCLVPAFFIAGGIAALVSTGAVLKYFGPTAKKYVSYGVASVSGTVLAVCSCTILPLFGGIYRKGAGLGPAITFLYSGPAINLLAIVLTARAIGLSMGVARGAGAIALSIIIGLAMAAAFRREELAKVAKQSVFGVEAVSKSPWLYLSFFGVLVAILLVGTSKAPGWGKVAVVIALANTLALIASQWLAPEEVKTWFGETAKLARQIFPVLLVGVFVAGMIKAVLPPECVVAYVGGNTLSANLLAAVAGALMYFSTLTEVPIIKALTDLGMAKGPALALLLSGPAVSLPNMLVVGRIMGARKTVLYVALVVGLSTLLGLCYGAIAG